MVGIRGGAECARRRRRPRVEENAASGEGGRGGGLPEFVDEKLGHEEDEDESVEKNHDQNVEECCVL